MPFNKFVKILGIPQIELLPKDNTTMLVNLIDDKQMRLCSQKKIFYM